jgi:hypothetical protein
MTSKHNPAQLDTQLDALRKATLSTDGTRQGSFAELFQTFMDIADAPALLDVSKPTKDKTLKEVIETCARRLVGNTALSLQGLTLLRVDRAGFIHGSFFAGASFGTFFYFEKERQGLLAFAQGGGVTRFARMTWVDLPEGGIPVRGPPAGSQRS